MQEVEKLRELLPLKFFQKRNRELGREYRSLVLFTVHNSLLEVTKERLLGDVLRNRVQGVVAA